MAGFKIETEDWSAGHLAVHREYLIGDDGNPELSLLRHPSYPFRASITFDDATEVSAELLNVARSYVARIREMSPQIPADLDRPAGFGWLPIEWDGPTGLSDPRGSFEVRRHSEAGDELDRTAVLMAGPRELRPDGESRPTSGGDAAAKPVGAGIATSKVASVTGLEVGLRIVAHVDSSAAGVLGVRVTGFSACGLSRAKEHPLHPALKRDEVIWRALELARSTLKFGSGTFHGFEAHETGLSAMGGASGGPDGGAAVGPTYLWHLETSVRADGSLAFGAVRTVRQVTDAMGAQPPATRRGSVVSRVILRDPASGGGGPPTRDGLLDQGGSDVIKVQELLEDADNGLFQVLQSKVADRENQDENTQSIDPARLPLRSDHLAAAHAYLRAREFFDLMRKFGFLPAAYFKFAKLPLRMCHRASFDKKPDGNVVNAQVCLKGDPLDLSKPYAPAVRPQLEVRFGSAALRHRWLLENDHGHMSAQPLGLAADPRWAWHEFGHVLSYAAGGALEFEFAHSAGDALAAVLNDPRSHLARGTQPASDSRDRLEKVMRGRTFPWVPTHRRHDREAASGWGWCGRLNRQRHAPRVLPPPLRKGYAEEQMLSSSIFRLYCSIGGNTFRHTGKRTRAAQYCVYLVMRAIALLGPAGLVPVRSADAFASAMIDADIGTRGLFASYAGGCVHKVVRWAFEQQGLFATGDPQEIVEGAGLPPPVDLWIKDKRQPADGGYQATPLLWRDANNQQWHAHEEDLKVDGNGKVRVVVGNRGSKSATAVSVQAWAAPATSGALSWQRLGDASVDRIAGGAETEVDISPKRPVPATPYYVIAEVTCPEDRSNFDPVSALPCASGEPPQSTVQLVNMVACDNNLGLRLFR